MPALDNGSMTSSVPLISPNSGLSFFPVAILAVAAVFFAVVAVVGIFAVVVVANRGDPDPTGRRPMSVYLFGVSFFTVFAALFGSFAVVQSVVQLIGTNTSQAGPALHPLGDAVARGATLAGIITGVSLVVLALHLRRGMAMAGRADPRLGPLGRVAQSYVAAVSFVAVIIAIIALVFALYEVARIIGPGVFQLSGTRTQTLRPLLSSAYLAVGALLILFLHLRVVPPDIRRGTFRVARGTPPGSASPGVPAGPPSAPQPPPTASPPGGWPSPEVPPMPSPLTAAPSEPAPGAERPHFQPPQPPFDPGPEPPSLGSPPPP